LISETYQSRIGKLPAVLALLLVVSLCAVACTTHQNGDRAESFEPTVILISLDGFRWDYIDKLQLPNMRQLADQGVQAEGLIPVYPSKTFPGHYSIVTGLYPGNHGIISNNMYDPSMDAEFHLHDREAMQDARWWGGEPIWVTAERQGLVAASMFWPGSETEIGGVRPTHWSEYDREMPFETRIGQVLKWLDLPADKRPRIITLYISEPNTTSHRFGPDSQEVAEVVRYVDGLIGDLVSGLEDRHIKDQVNLILVSDHGFAQTDETKVVLLDDLVELEDGELFEQGAIVQILPGEGRHDLVYAALKGADPHLAIYNRDEIPGRYHLQGSDRVPPILGVPDVGWRALTRKNFELWRQQTFDLGEHGQDPADPMLHGIFVAKGPAFQSGLNIDRFESVEIYNVLAAVLGLDPAPNDGDPNKLTHILKE